MTADFRAGLPVPHRLPARTTQNVVVLVWRAQAWPRWISKLTARMSFLWTKARLPPPNPRVLRTRRSRRGLPWSARRHRRPSVRTRTRHPRHRRSRTGRPIPQGRQHRHHGLERQDHHHRADRPHPPRIRHPSQVGGNIGTPPTSMVSTSRDGQWNVLELSSFQLETISTFHAKIAVALNVTDNHLDRHYTFENYAAAKAQAVRDADSRRFRDPQCR